MTPGATHVAGLHRYPVKGLSAEPLDHLALTRRDGLAHDRGYALALGTTSFDPARPEPLDKGHFLMLRVNESLAALHTRYDPETSILTITPPGSETISADLSTPEGRSDIESFFTGYAGPAARGRVRLVCAAGHKFTDVSHLSPGMMRAVSVVNLASVRELSEVAGLALHPLRFRANIHLDGLPPGAELDWVGRDIRIGAMTLRGALRTRRCAAIDVDPLTAARDTNLTRTIARHYGHPDLGVYLEVIEDGRIALGDPVSVTG